MPNQPSADKEVLSFQIRRETKRKLVKLAARRGESISQTITSILTHATDQIELTPQDYREIAKATQRARDHKPSRAKKPAQAIVEKSKIGKA